MTCDAMWTSVDLANRGMSPRETIPALPVQWPRCPDCFGRLSRVGESQLWRCGEVSAEQMQELRETYLVGPSGGGRRDLVAQGRSDGFVFPDVVGGELEHVGAAAEAVKYPNLEKK